MKLRDRPARSALLAGILLVLMAGALSTEDTRAATTVVNVGRNAADQFADAYSPASVTITAGDTVRWEWDGNRNHDVTAYTGGLFGSPGGRGGMTGPGSVYSFTFDQPGTYTYYCQERANRSDADPAFIDASILAGRMVGKVVVLAASDTTPPSAGSLNVAPNPTGSAVTATLTAVITDGGVPNSNVAAAEYFIDSAGAPGSGRVMAVDDGAFDEPSEGVSASVGLAGLPPGDHSLLVRGRDAAGNWGATASTTLTVSSSTVAAVQVGQTASATAGRAFNPAVVAIAPGDLVRWQWFDGAHDVHAYDGSYSSGSRGGINGPGSTFERTFGSTGIYTYYCSNHAGPGDADPTRIDENIAAGKMVGKVVVAIGPSTSGVSATPNPTGGATTVVLTALIADTGAPAANVTAAEYFIDTPGTSGSGAPMRATDGAFDTPTEAVDATVGVAALAPGDHALLVHGRNASGTWGPLVAVVLTVPSGGGFGVTASPVLFPNVEVTGIAQSVASSGVIWRAEDSTGAGTGWRVTLAASHFSSGAAVIPVTGLRVRLAQSAIARLSGAGDLPVSQAQQFTAFAPDTSLVLMRAAVGAGQGIFEFMPEFQLAIPAAVVEGTYQASIVVTMVSGP